MADSSISDAAKAVVRRNTEEVQGRGNFELFEELFADDFLDHTPQPGGTPDKAGVRNLYRRLRAAFPDFHAEIHWQRADSDVVKCGRHAGPGSTSLGIVGIVTVACFVGYPTHPAAVGHCDRH